MQPPHLAQLLSYSRRRNYHGTSGSTRHGATILLAFKSQEFPVASTKKFLSLVRGEPPRMFRSLVIAPLLAVFLVLSASQSASAQSIGLPLIPREMAQQWGLQRAWVAQVPLDRARSKILYIKLQAGLLLVVTSENMLYVIDPETGHIQWSFLIGDRRLMPLSASANATHIAVANTARLFLLSRATGDVVVNREITGTPSRGPQLTSTKVIIPLVNGPLESYPSDDRVTLDELSDPKNVLEPKYFQSAGRLFGEPAVSDEFIVWAGDLNQISDHLFGDHPADFNALVPERVSTAPALLASQAYVGTELGYLVAYDANGLTELWRSSTGAPIHHRPIATESALYVLPDDGGIVALDPKSGDLHWSSPDPIQFATSSPDRVYTIDNFGRLTILNAKTGALAAAFQLPHSMKALTNDQTDRLVLYTDEGLIQSLHEPGLAQPHLHAPPKPEPTTKKAGAGAKAAAPAADAAPAAKAKPAAAAPAAK
jgi:hypothetical protein